MTPDLNRQPKGNAVILVILTSIIWLVLSSAVSGDHGPLGDASHCDPDWPVQRYIHCIDTARDEAINAIRRGTHPGRNPDGGSFNDPDTIVSRFKIDKWGLGRENSATSVYESIVGNDDEREGYDAGISIGHDVYQRWEEDDEGNDIRVAYTMPLRPSRFRQIAETDDCYFVTDERTQCKATVTHMQFHHWPKDGPVDKNGWTLYHPFECQSTKDGRSCERNTDEVERLLADDWKADFDNDMHVELFLRQLEAELEGRKVYRIDTETGETLSTDEARDTPKARTIERAKYTSWHWRNWDRPISRVAWLSESTDQVTFRFSGNRCVHVTEQHSDTSLYSTHRRCW